MEENRLVTLKLVGFNERKLNSFHAILTLATRTLKKRWQVVDNDGADFFLLSVEATKNQELLKTFPAERCMFCATKNDLQIEHSLLVDEKHLPSLSALAGLFNQMSDNFRPDSEQNASESANQPSNSAMQTEIVTEEFFDAQTGLLGHLLAAEHTQLIVSLNNHPDYAALYIDTEKNTYYSQNNLEQLDPYILALEALSIKSCSNLEMEHAVINEHLKSYSLKDLIWYIVIKTSAGKVIKGYSKTDIVTLRSWPDLKLFKCLEYAKVATFMKNNAAPLETIAEYTKMSIAEINNFYNACYLVGLIEKRNQQTINKREIPAERLALLAKIDARLK